MADGYDIRRRIDPTFVAAALVHRTQPELDFRCRIVH